MSIKLKDYQKESIKHISNGSILCGGVGSGKSITSLAYYFEQMRGSLEPYSPMNNPKDLYIITTARKRDTYEWDGELSHFLMSTNSKLNFYDNQIIIDSWNNISKYKNVQDAFFIFDEQRVVGSGAWVKAFLKIAKINRWILLSATPGDTWSDYIPVFIANGFYKNKTEFSRDHIVYSRFTKYPKVDRYIDTGRLIRLRNNILVQMDYQRPTVSHHNDLYVEHDAFAYKRIFRERWNTEKNQPIQTASELCFELRKLVNSDISRMEAVEEIIKTKGRAIIFYNFNYELEILKQLDCGCDVEIAEWNGHKHQEIPNSNKWIYLVQYNAGNEGWNCIKTDTIIFYSQNYSYKVMVQAAGRIDRMNTPFTDLYYYHIKSRSGIDIAISRALSSKKKFNEVNYTRSKNITFGDNIQKTV